MIIKMFGFFSSKSFIGNVVPSEGAEEVLINMFDFNLCLIISPPTCTAEEPAWGACAIYFFHEGVFTVK